MTSRSIRRIVAIVAECKPTSLDVVVAAAFAEDKGGGEESALSSRAFRFDVRAMRRVGQGRASFIAAEGHLVVDYRDVKNNRAGLNLAIAEDYAVITEALADQRLWRASESGIRILGADSDSQPGAPLFAAVVDDVAVGASVAGRRLRIVFPFEVIA
jgi:hypothetical protein